MSLVQASAVDDDGKPGHLLVSGSRDHLIQIYDSKKQYEPVQIIEMHQGTVTSVRFIEENVGEAEKP